MCAARLYKHACHLSVSLQAVVNSTVQNEAHVQTSQQYIDRQSHCRPVTSSCSRARLVYNNLCYCDANLWKTSIKLIQLQCSRNKVSTESKRVKNISAQRLLQCYCSLVVSRLNGLITWVFILNYIMWFKSSQRFLEGADTNKMVNCLKYSTNFSKEVR